MQCLLVLLEGHFPCWFYEDVARGIVRYCPTSQLIRKVIGFELVDFVFRVVAVGMFRWASVRWDVIYRGEKGAHASGLRLNQPVGAYLYIQDYPVPGLYTVFGVYVLFWVFWPCPELAPGAANLWQAVLIPMHASKNSHTNILATFPFSGIQLLRSRVLRSP
jgi:hypothetical protein